MGKTANVSGVRVASHREAIPWQRDVADPFAIRCKLKHNVVKVDVKFGLLLHAGSEGGAAFMTVALPKVMTMNWNDVLVYPTDANAPQLHDSATASANKWVVWAGRASRPIFRHPNER